MRFTITIIVKNLIITITITPGLVYNSWKRSNDVICQKTTFRNI